MSAPATEPVEEPARKRGGQPGNSNALRHGFYSRALVSKHTRELLEGARALRGELTVSDEIDVLRVAIARLLESGDLMPFELAALAQALIKANLAEQKLSGTAAANPAMAALDTVMADVRAAAAAGV
jgi:hypothetical protein